MAKKSVVTGKAPNVAGGLGVQAVNMSDASNRYTASTGPNTPTAVRNKYYGGATQKKIGLAGGLGMPGYLSGGKTVIATGQRTPTKIRNAVYGEATPQPMSAPIKTQVSPKETIRTFVREKLTPTRKTGPQMALNRVTGNTTGFTSGVKTGKTITKSGVATKTPMFASRRAEQNAFNKGGVAGPSRGGGGGMGKSSGGASRSTGGGNTGRGDVCAGRRGGRG